MYITGKIIACPAWKITCWHITTQFYLPGDKIYASGMQAHLNSFPPSATYMRQWTVSSLVQVMACRLFCAKPLPEPVMVYCQLDSWQQVSVKFESEFYHFLSMKCIWTCRLSKWHPFCPGRDELMSSPAPAVWTWKEHLCGQLVYLDGVLKLKK